MPSSEDTTKSVTDKVIGVDYGHTEARVLAHLIASSPLRRKHISERTCHGKDVACLPGLNGKCVACFDD